MFDRKKAYASIIILALLVLVTSIPLVKGAGWYNEGWTHRKSVSIEGKAGAGTDYQVYLPITYESNMQADFDDLRFTAVDGITLLDYWRETYVASTSAVVWVKVTANLDSDQIIYMYYGNSTVSTTSNGTATFLFYEDWASETIDAGRWDTVSADGTITYDDTDANHGSVLWAVGNAPDAVWHIESLVDATAPTALLFRSYIESTAASTQRTRQGSGAYTDAYALVASNYGADEFMVADDNANADNKGLLAGNFDSYHTFWITRDGTNAALWSDYVPVVSGSCEPDIISNPMSMIYVRDTEHELYSDWIAGMKFILGGPVGGTFGDEEPYYNMQDTVDSVLIFAGLIMIPTSTMYLVRGGKEEMSQDKVFYFLIAFVIGWALVIGGITP